MHAALEEKLPRAEPHRGPPGVRETFKMTDALRLRSMLALGVSVAALALAAPAFAANDADAPAAKDDNTIQPVIVTASGRATAVQDVPIAISAVTADTLKNANVTRTTRSLP